MPSSWHLLLSLFKVTDGAHVQCTETNQIASHWEFKNVRATKQNKTMQSKNSRCWHRGKTGYIEIVICVVTDINQSSLVTPIMCKVHNCTILNTKEALCEHMHHARKQRGEWYIACNVVWVQSIHQQRAYYHKQIAFNCHHLITSFSNLFCHLYATLHHNSACTDN